MCVYLFNFIFPQMYIVALLYFFLFIFAHVHLQFGDWVGLSASGHVHYSGHPFWNKDKYGISVVLNGC